MSAREAAQQTIHVFVAPELCDAPLGTVAREEGETEAEYARRAWTLDALFGARRASRRD